MNNIVKQIVKDNQNLKGNELLNWSMNQLFRAARELQLLSTACGDTAAMGCDATATVILKRLIKTKQGWNLIKQTNPKLLRGYKNP